MTLYLTEAPELVHDDLPWLVLEDHPINGRLLAAFHTSEAAAQWGPLAEQRRAENG